MKLLQFNIRQLRLGQKFALTGGALGVSFLVIAGSYFYVSNVTSTADTRNQETAALNENIARVQLTLTRARVDIDQFFSTPDMKHVEARRQKAAEVDRLLQGMIDSVSDRESVANIKALRDQLTANQQLVEKAVATQVLLGLNEAGGIQGQFRDKVHEAEDLLQKQNQIAQIASMLQMRRHEKDFLLRGASKYVDQHTKEWERFQKLAAGNAEVLRKVRAYSEGFDELVAVTQQRDAQRAEFLAGFGKVDPLLATVVKTEAEAASASRSEYQSTTSRTTVLFYSVIAAISVTIGFALLALVRNVTRPVNALHKAVDDISKGKLDVQTNITTGDELQELGEAFDKMVAEKGKYLRTEQENEMLNNSVIAILRAVSQLGKGNLTVKVPVNEDVTGALADAINAMAESTARTLAGVADISREVRSASQDGRETVLSTAKGMNEIRGTIQETGKRIKRLGERSQEITGIVKLIDDIAERTSVLALNANMQAAMAGEAGRGFRVVADEVQRLAERSKEATDQISKLVTNIQSETNDTMATMDRAIGEVVRGGELAEKAAIQVTHLDELGGTLLDSVQTFTLPEELIRESQTASRRETGRRAA